MLILGSHVPMKKPDNFKGAIKTALSYEANSLMVYTGAPQNIIRTPQNHLQVYNALTLAYQNNFSCNNFVGHAPYIVNLANGDPQKRAFAIDFLSEELKRFALMKINKMVLHPGNFLKSDLHQAICWVAQGIDAILENTYDLNVDIVLETMAGKGTEIGRTLEELSQIRNLVKNRQRVSFCLDTCHLFDAGYDLKNNFTLFFKDIEHILGIQNISVIHLNDSKNELYSHKDRHENIGFGKIGFNALMQIIYHPSFSQIPKILETPYINGKAPYLEEIKMIKNKIFNPELKNLFN